MKVLSEPKRIQQWIRFHKKLARELRNTGQMIRAAEMEALVMQAQQAAGELHLIKKSLDNIGPSEKMEKA